MNPKNVKNMKTNLIVEDNVYWDYSVLEDKINTKLQIYTICHSLCFMLRSSVIFWNPKEY